MDDLGDPPTTARWLALATAVLLVIGVVSAGVIDIVSGGSGDGVVAAAGPSGTVEPATTTTLPPSPTTQPARPAAATSTTVPKAAAAVLKALGTTAPPTTQAPTTTTTAPPVTTTAPTTSTTPPPRAMVIVANQSARAFDITVNGQTVRLATGAEATFQLNVPSPIQGQAVGEPACMVGATGDLFQAGSRYRATLVAGEEPCSRLTITPL